MKLSVANIHLLCEIKDSRGWWYASNGHQRRTVALLLREGMIETSNKRVDGADNVPRSRYRLTDAGATLLEKRDERLRTRAARGGV